MLVIQSKSQNPKVLRLIIENLTRYKDVARSIQLVAMSKLGMYKAQIADRHNALMLASYLFDRHDAEDGADSETSIVSEDSEGGYRSVLVVCVSNDKSCCGLLNSMVLLSCISYVKFLLECKKRVTVYCIGNKGSYAIRKIYKRIVSRTFRKIEKEAVSFCMAYAITYKVVSFNFDKCFLVFNRYVSRREQRTMHYELESYRLFISRLLSNRTSEDLIVSILAKYRSNSSFLRNLYYFNFTLLILDTLEEQEYCALASRINVMDHAVKSVRDIIVGLLLKYNQARQSTITNEIVEILNASENMA